MKRNPLLLLLGALVVFALAAPAGADEEADLWVSLRDEGIYSLDQLVPGAASPDSDETLQAPETLDATAATVATDSVSLPGTAGTNDEATPSVVAGPVDDTPDGGALARTGDPSIWRGRGSYRNHYFDSRPAPPGAGEVLEPGAWPMPDAERSDDPNAAFGGDPYAYTSPEFENRQEALQRSGSDYGYGYAAPGASRGYGGPARPGGGRRGGSDYDPDEDWEADDGE